MNLPHRPLSTARGQGRECERGRGWERDIYLHAPLSTAGRDNPQINMTFLQAQTCVHMGRRSGRVQLPPSPLLPLPDPLCLSQPVEINSPTGRSSKNKGGCTLDSYGHGPKSQTFEQHLRLPHWGRSKRTGCTPQSAPVCPSALSLFINLITQKASS